MIERRSPLAAVLVLAGALALAPPAAAKDGAALSPALSSLKPGAPTDVTVYAFGVWRNNRQVVPPPAAGVRPVVVLRSQDGRRELRFRATALDRNDHAVARVTVPGPTGRRWTVSVVAGGHRFRVEMQPRFAAGADYAGPTSSAVPASAPVRAAAADTSSGAPAWPFVLAGVLALAGLGTWRWRRGGARP